MAKTTKSALAARVIELEEKLAEITSERDALGRDFEGVCWENRELEALLVKEKADRAAAAQAHAAEFAAMTENRDEWMQASQSFDAFVAFVAALPRKLVYRALARALHPDMGGETATMQALTQAWSATRARSQS